MSRLSRGIRLILAKKQLKQLSFSPAQILVISFIFLIVLGGLALTTPAASSSGQATSFIDAFFTATSAVCVTGLVVVDTADHWSTFGEVVILLLIQVGGLGFMTMTTLFALLIGKKINLRERLILQETFHTINLEGLVRLTKYIIILTIFLELVAALILAVHWSSAMDWKKSLYYGVFHAISAFNNAGFDLFGGFNGLTGFSNDIIVNVVISFLIIMGGLGFFVIVDLYEKKTFKALSLHTKVVLVTTGALLTFGALGMAILEFSNAQTLGGLSPTGKALASFFQGVAPRTAGFNTIHLTEMRDATQLFIIMLMFIGASPGSTGGGIKTTTFATMLIAIWSYVRGEQETNVFGRRLSKEFVYKSLTIILISISLVVVVTMALTITEAGHASLLEANFEAVSAFATVGLSLGLTPQLTEAGKAIIIFTMFVGRVGPLTIAVALSRKRAKTCLRFPEEKIMIG